MTPFQKPEFLLAYYLNVAEFSLAQGKVGTFDASELGSRFTPCCSATCTAPMSSRV